MIDIIWNHLEASDRNYIRVDANGEKINCALSNSLSHLIVGLDSDGLTINYGIFNQRVRIIPWVRIKDVRLESR